MTRKRSRKGRLPRMRDRSCQPTPLSNKTPSPHVLRQPMINLAAYLCATHRDKSWLKECKRQQLISLSPPQSRPTDTDTDFLMVCRAGWCATRSHLAESRWHLPSMRLAGTNISLDGLANAVVAAAAVLKLRWTRICAGHGEPHLKENRLNGGDGTPSAVGKKLSMC